MRFQHWKTLQEIHGDLADSGIHQTGQWRLAEHGLSNKPGWHPSRASALGRTPLTDPAARIVTSKLAASRPTKHTRKPRNQICQTAERLSSRLAGQPSSRAAQQTISPTAQSSSQFNSPQATSQPANQPNQAISTTETHEAACPLAQTSELASQPAKQPGSTQPRHAGQSLLRQSAPQ